jgi:hypothetical protein
MDNLPLDRLNILLEGLKALAAYHKSQVDLKVAMSVDLDKNDYQKQILDN